MEYHVGDKKLRIYPQYLEEIGSGYEGIAYKYRGKVLKLYYDRPYKKVLSLRDCEYMQKLSTERVLLPSEAVTDKRHSMKGYTISPYIGEDINVYNINGKMFLDERKLIHEELIYLGENYISVDDFCLDNLKISDKFYLLDPGSYIVHWNMMSLNNEMNIIYLANKNIEYFEAFLYHEVFLRHIRKCINNLKMCKELLNAINSNCVGKGFFSTLEYLEHYIEPDISLDENIKHIIKRHRN